MISLDRRMCCMLVKYLHMLTKPTGPTDRVYMLVGDSCTLQEQEVYVDVG